MPKAHTPFQWFGQNGVGELQRKVGLLRDDLAALRRHDPLARSRRRPTPRASPAGATVASGACIERVWRAGGTFQEWSERFQLDRWLDAMAAEGLDPDWYVTRHRTDDEILPWDHIAAGPAPRLPLERLAGSPSPSTGSPTAGGPPATTVGCAPTTRSSTSWPRRCRRRAAARAPARASTSGAGPTCPVHARELTPDEGRPRASRCGCASPSGARCGSSRTATSPAPSSGRSASSSSRSPSPGLLAPAQGELRARAVGRPRERRRVPRRRAHRAVDPERLAEPLIRRAARGHATSPAPRGSSTAPPRCRNRSPQSSTGSTAVDGHGRARSRMQCSHASRRRALRERRAHGHPHPEGQGERGRHPARARSIEHRVSATTAPRPRSSSPCRRNPAVPDRVRCSTPSSVVGIGLTEHRVSRTSQWIERGGARLEPLEADALAPALEASAS